MRRGRHIVFIYCLLVVCGLLSGCAQNVVRLAYPAPAETVIPAPEAKSLCVVLFEDARGKGEIGVRRDNDRFQPRSPVDDWASRAMADELAQRGFRVTYAATLEQARQSAPAYIVTGVIEEVWLTENSLTSYTSSMRFSISMQRGSGAHLFKNNFSSTLTRTVMPTSGAAQDILTEGLKELLQAAAKKIAQSIQ